MHKRRRIVVDRPFQLGLALRFGLWVAAGCALTGAAVAAYFLWRTGSLSPATKIYYVGPELEGGLRQLSLLELVAPPLAVILITAMTAAAIAGLYVSHRIAGPLYRIEKVLTDLAEGRVPDAVRFRAADEFQRLAGKLTEVCRIVKLGPTQRS